MKKRKTNRLVIQTGLPKNEADKLCVTAHTLRCVRLTVICTLLLILSACSLPTDNQNQDHTEFDDPIARPVNKFQAKSYADNDAIKYSYTCGGYDYYYIYLGELANIPLYYQAAEYHSGIAFKYTFSITEGMETAISETITQSSQETISVLNEYTVSRTTGEKLSPEIGYEFNILDVFKIGGKVNAEKTWSDYTSNTASTGFQQTTSLTNTIQHAITRTSSTTVTKEFNLTKDNKIGYYRYTYFGASDVYLYVIRDPAKPNEIYYEFREYVIPDSYAWVFDYSETPSFRKSDATSFELDISLLENLPKPSLNLSDSDVSIVPSYTIVYHANGGSGIASQTVNLGGTATRPANPTRIGYLFVDWYSDSGLSAVYSFSTPVTADITLYAKWGISITIEQLFSPGTPNQSYRVEGITFPATIEVYALGGGGGQGGHSSAYSSGTLNLGTTWWFGTGGSGGGGAAAYMKFTLGGSETIVINAGRGGTGGYTNSSPKGTDWKYGGKGNRGGNTTVSWSGGTLTVNGGEGGGLHWASNNNRDNTGGTGGSASTRPTTALTDWSSVAGGNGQNGQNDRLVESRGGSAGRLTIGSKNLFGGNTGGYNYTESFYIDPGPGAGGGGSYNYSGKNLDGRVGGDGQVIIRVTYIQ